MVNVKKIRIIEGMRNKSLGLMSFKNLDDARKSINSDIDRQYALIAQQVGLVNYKKEETENEIKVRFTAALTLYKSTQFVYKIMVS